MSKKGNEYPAEALKPFKSLCIYGIALCDMQTFHMHDIFS